MADADQGPYLEPPYRLPSPDSPVAPPVLRKPQSQDEPDEGEGQQDDTDEGTVSNATPTTTRPETPQAPGGEPSPSGRRVWGLRSPIMMNRLSFYSDSSRSPLSPLRQLSSSLIPSPAFVSKDGGGGDADDELDTDELEGMDKDSDTDSLTQDSKDVLVERLNDLVKNLAAGRRLQSADISALHAKVDEMESLVPATHQVEAQRKRKPRSSLPRQDSRGAQSTNPLHVTQQGHEAVTGEATTESTTPLEFSGEVSPFPAFIPSPSTPGPAGAVARPQANARVVAEAEKLNMELTKVFENMKARSIESDHLHRLLIERAEGAAMRIIELEKKVSEL
ncbi:hypothetical protein GQ53DRAFT_749223 [Thozetella sp. PMI_491]|nr:hypothetical protein GQ53DRAFT_749223 [Thozetella sp. PMI_491]